MKKLKAVSLVLMIIFLLNSFSSLAFANDIQTNNSQIASDKIPSDFENDMWLNSDFKRLKIGETYTMFSRRIVQLVQNSIYNTGLINPNFNYEVINGDSVTVKKVENDPDQKAVVTAVKNGVSIIKVTYDAVKPSWSVKTFGASSVVNTAYMAVEVNDNPAEINITSSVLDKLTTFDTIYYKDGKIVKYEFDVSANNADKVEVTCNGNLLKDNNGKYTADLENRTNIIGVKAIKNNKYITKYYMVDARKIKINIENITRPGAPVQVSDKVKVSFYGITLPISKIAGIYNPCFYDKMWGSTKGSAVEYTLGNKKVYGRCEQWDLATNNSFIVTFNESGTYTYTNGNIEMNWWGEKAGAHKEVYNNNYEFGGFAAERSDNFSVLPDFTIKVTNKKDVLPTKIILDKTKLEMEEKTSSKLIASVYPNTTTKKSLVWESSDESVLTVFDGEINALKPGKAIITVKSNVEYLDIKDSCEVTVIAELPATNEEKEDLKNKIIEAKKIEKSDCESTLKAWQIFNKEIDKAEDVYNDNTVLLEKVNNVVKDLDNAINKYKDAVEFAYVVTQKTVGDNIEVEVNFPNLILPKSTGFNEEWYLIFKSDLKGYEEIKTNNLVNDKESLKTFKFLVPKDTNAVFTLTEGLIKYVYQFHPQFPYKQTKEFYKNKYPDITIEVGEVVYPEKLTIDTDNVILKDNESYKIEYSFSPNNITNKNIIWKSSDEEIATVDENGVVTGVGDGKVIISAEFKYGNLKDNIEVTVENIDVRIKNIISKINKLGVIDINNSKEIFEIKELYQSLPEERRLEVVNYNDFIKYQENFEKIKNVYDAIENLDELNLFTLGEINKVEKLYNELTNEQKKSVINSDKYIKLQKQVDENKLELESALDTVNKIKNINKITFDNQLVINIARNSYDELNKIAKSYVYNYKELIKAEKIYKDLYDKSKADFVISKIDDIGEVTIDKEDLIITARWSYTALTKDQKMKISNYNKLVDAENKLEILKKISSKPIINLPEPPKYEYITVVEKEIKKIIISNDNLNDSLIKSEKIEIPNQIDKINKEIDFIINNDVDDINKIIDIYKKIDKLDDLEKSELENIDKFEEAKESLSKLLHEDKKLGITAAGLEWFDKLKINKIELDKNQNDIINKMVGENGSVISSMDINIENLLDNKNYSTHDFVTISIDSEKFENIDNYKSIVAVHYLENGKAEYIKCDVKDNKIVFVADSFSPYSIVGLDLTWKEFISSHNVVDQQSQNNNYIWIIVISASLLVLIIVLVYKFKKSKG